MTTTTSREILERVITVLEEREANYDHPHANFQRIADLDSVILGHTVTTVEVALLNIAQKIGRLVFALRQGKDLTDHFIDIIGYTVCAYRCWEYTKKQASKKPVLTVRQRGGIVDLETTLQEALTNLWKP